MRDQEKMAAHDQMRNLAACGTGSSPTYPGLGIDPNPYLLDKLRVG
jgi:hypothetical protein